MATQTEVAERIDLACQLLDDRISVPAIARHLQHVYGVSRATAYGDIRKAAEHVDRSDDGPEEAYDPTDPQDILKQLHHAWRASIARGRAKEAKLWADQIDRVKRQYGQGGPHYRLG